MYQRHQIADLADGQLPRKFDRNDRGASSREVMHAGTLHFADLIAGRKRTEERDAATRRRFFSCSVCATAG